VQRLKKDFFGSVWRTEAAGRDLVIRDLRDARW